MPSSPVADPRSSSREAPHEATPTIRSPSSATTTASSWAGSANASRQAATCSSTDKVARCSSGKMPAYAHRHASFFIVTKPSTSSTVAGRIVAGTGLFLRRGPRMEQAVGVAVDERFPRGLDDVLADPHGGPFALAVGQVDQHAHRRARADASVEHTHAEVLELHVIERGVVVGQGLPKRVVEGADRTLALGALDVARPARDDLDGRLGERLLARALLDMDAVALD